MEEPDTRKIAMMPQFSNISKERLGTCHQDLQTIFYSVIKYFDCTIVCGYRDEAEQNRVYNNGFSKVRYPGSKHNLKPSMAVDAIPWPIEWDNLERMKYFAWYVMGVARMLKAYGAIEHELVSGLDWDNDTILKDTTFKDHPHFQLKF